MLLINIKNSTRVMKVFMVSVACTLACYSIHSTAFTLLHPLPSSSSSQVIPCHGTEVESNMIVRFGQDSSLKMVRKEQNSSNEIQDAFRKEDKFGKESKESRVAWDIVEEIDASRSHHSTSSTERGGSSTEELIHQVDFMNHIHNLYKILSNVWKPATSHTITLLATLSQIHSTQLRTTKIGYMPEKLANAIAEAKIENDIHGPNDSKTKAALQRAVEISELSKGEYTNDDGYHAYKSVLDKHALEDAMDSIKKIEHLMNLLEIENKRLGEQ